MTEAWQSDWLVNDSKVACLRSGAGRSSQKSWLIPVAAVARVRRGAYYHHRSNQGLRKLSRPSLPSSHPSREFKYGGGEARSGVWGGGSGGFSSSFFFEMVRSSLRNPLCCPFFRWEEIGGEALIVTDLLAQRQSVWPDRSVSECLIPVVFTPSSGKVCQGTVRCYPVSGYYKAKHSDIWSWKRRQRRLYTWWM